MLQESLPKSLLDLLLAVAGHCGLAGAILSWLLSPDGREVCTRLELLENPSLVQACLPWRMAVQRRLAASQFCGSVWMVAEWLAVIYF